MSLIALIADTHFGYSNDDPTVLDYQIKFFNEVFFPTLKERGVEQVFHAGDLFDRRKYVNFRTLQRVKQEVFRKFETMGLGCTMATGNHDLYYRTAYDCSGSKELMEGQNWFGQITDDTSLDNVFHIGAGKKLAVIPWLTEANVDRYVQQLSTLDPNDTLILGHFELSGFTLQPGVISEHGTDQIKEHLVKFNRVWSGHYHIRQTKGNLQYLGSPYQMNWGDYGDDRGFYLYDPAVDQLEFIKNPDVQYVRVVYKTEADLPDISKYAGKNIKLVFENNDLPASVVENVVQMVSDAKPRDCVVDLPPIQNVAETIAVEAPAGSDELLHIITGYVDGMGIGTDKKKSVRDLMIRTFSSARVIGDTNG